MRRRVLLLIAVIGAGCASAPPPPKIDLVSSTIVTGSCTTLSGANSRLAQEAMRKLVEGCTSVPGGSTKFTVRLLPGGRIALPQGPDQPGVIPTCVLKNDLRHKVRLAKACDLVVRLDETAMALPSREGGTSPAP